MINTEEKLAQLRKYAIERSNKKLVIKPEVSSKEIKYQEEVLDRMVKRGCKPCEKKRQQKYIESLKNENN